MNNVTEKQIRVKGCKRKYLKKDAKISRAYQALCALILTVKEHQRFNPYSLLDAVHRAFALEAGENWITTCQGDRNQRKRDYDKNIFDKHYVLRPHTFGTILKVECPANAGYYKQKWIKGAPSLLGNNVRLARIKGPEAFYMPAYINTMSVFVVGATCKLLVKLYDNQISFCQFKLQLRQSINAINEKKFKGRFTEVQRATIFDTLLNYINKGWKNHLSGGPFGRGPGAPAKNVTRCTTRPRLFARYLGTVEAHKLVVGGLRPLAKDMGCSLTKGLKQATYIAVLKYYASDLYHKNMRHKVGTSLNSILTHCLEKVALAVMNNHVHKSVNNLSATKNNTEHHFSVRGGKKYKLSRDNEEYFSEINSSSSTRVRKPQPPPPNLLDSRPCAAEPKPKRRMYKGRGGPPPTIRAMVLDIIKLSG